MGGVCGYAAYASRHVPRRQNASRHAPRRQNPRRHRQSRQKCAALQQIIAHALSPSFERAGQRTKAISLPRENRKKVSGGARDQISVTYVALTPFSRAEYKLDTARLKASQPVAAKMMRRLGLCSASNYRGRRRATHDDAGNSVPTASTRQSNRSTIGKCTPVGVLLLRHQGPRMRRRGRKKIGSDLIGSVLHKRAKPKLP